ncbi:MAG: tRNA pseudouridine(38-40) synthase TruA [Clostridia bacterium]
MKTVFIVSFKGTAYSGWQVQPNAVTIQKTLQNAIEKVIEHPISLTGCGRTDSGVHANEFYCHIDTVVELSAEKLSYAINRVLPNDICVKRVIHVDDSFHSRYSAKGKEYVYVILNSKIKDVFAAEISHRFSYEIDVDYVNEIAKDFVGTHDFKSFMAKNSKVEDTNRTVWYFRAERENNFVKFYVAADGFLYNMVRIMIGTVLQIISGRIKIPINQIIDKRNRAYAGDTVPPYGLFLNKVFY